MSKILKLIYIKFRGQISKISRTRFCTYPRVLVEKNSLHISSIDRKSANNLKITQVLLRKSKDSMCTNADKGNISVLMKRSEYIKDMEELLGNVENFEILY